MQSYGFRIYFRTPAGRLIAGTDPELSFTLPEISRPIIIRKLAHKENHVSGTPETYVLVGSGFPTEEDARNYGQQLKQALVIYGITSRMGVDAGQDIASSGFSKEIKAQFLERHNIQLRDFIHGLDVYAESPPVEYLTISATGSSLYTAINIESELSQENYRTASLSAKLKLALEIYNLTFFEPNTKTRFLTLVTVIEVLSSRRRQSEGICTGINELKDIVSKFNLTPTEREILINGLGNLKRASISSACHQLVKESIGAEQAAVFSDCYSARSQLLHTGTTERDTNTMLGPLDLIVQEVLLWCIRSGRQ